MERYDLDHLDQLQEYLSKRLSKQVDLFTHSLQLLMNWTEAERRMDRATKQHWATVRKWQVNWRYDPSAGGPEECEQYFKAADVVLRFIRNSV